MSHVSIICCSASVNGFLFFLINPYSISRLLYVVPYSFVMGCAIVDSPETSSRVIPVTESTESKLASINSELFITFFVDFPL